MPELLQRLDITGRIVTIDALGAQIEIAKTIIEDGRDYLLAVKENQGHLFKDIRSIFEVEVAQGMEHAPCQHA